MSDHPWGELGQAAWERLARARTGGRLDRWVETKTAMAQYLGLAISAIKTAVWQYVIALVECAGVAHLNLVLSVKTVVCGTVLNGVTNG